MSVVNASGGGYTIDATGMGGAVGRGVCYSSIKHSVVAWQPAVGTIAISFTAVQLCPG